jgi:hypothetical protein
MFDFEKFSKMVHTVVTRFVYPAKNPGYYGEKDLREEIAEALKSDDTAATPVANLIGIQEYQDLTPDDVGQTLIVSTRSGDRFLVFIARFE